MIDAANYSVTETLRDRRKVEIRAQRSHDREGMQEAIARSSSGSLYRRFFAVRREFSEKETDYFLDIDFVNHVALVAVAHDAGRPTIVGGGRYVVVQPGQAEVAFAIVSGISDLSVGVATAVSIAMIALVCLLAGLVAHTLIAQQFVNALESSVLSKIPAYEYLKQESASALGVAEIGELPVVFVPMEGGWQLGVQTEALSNGLVSIFVPGAPNPHSGSVFFFSTDIVRPAGIELAAALGCLRRCGAGASALGAAWPSDVRG